MSAVPGAMPLRASLEVLRGVRRDGDVVIATMGPAREWMTLSAHPLDLIFLPSAMGHATSLGTGLALAQPDRRVIVCNGDGSMLMNLGSLATIAAAAPSNLHVLLFDNGVYEVTGGQPTPGSAAGRADGGRVDFAAVARGCGIRSVFSFSTEEEWRAAAGGVLDGPGPSFVVLEVGSVAGTPGPRSPGPAAERARAFRAALGGQGG